MQSTNVVLPGENGPIAVAFLVFGDSQPTGKEFLRNFEELSKEFDMAQPIDIRKIYKTDPSKCARFKVRHDRNADFDDTQVAVHQFTALYDTVHCLCHEVMQQTNALDTTVATCLPKIIPVYCAAGQHRADGATKSAQHRVLNVIDFGVGRAFDANVFSLNACSNVRQQIQAASKWLSKPWTVIEPNADWGKVACASGERAQFVHEAIGANFTCTCSRRTARR